MQGASIFSDALLVGMKAAPVSLRKAVIGKHHKMIGSALWDETMFCVHLQDNRLTDKEREVIAAIGTRLHGARSVI